MRATDLPVIYERIDWDDQTLLRAYNRLQQDLSHKKAQLTNSELSADEHHYLGLVVAKLAYCFAKEEFDRVSHEMNRRGLVTT